MREYLCKCLCVCVYGRGCLCVCAVVAANFHYSFKMQSRNVALAFAYAVRVADFVAVSTAGKRLSKAVMAPNTGPGGPSPLPAHITELRGASGDRDEDGQLVGHG